jgi:NAD(P)-dependent dehydrogenase (short-subunit alcohol dehydrogenase family)
MDQSSRPRPAVVITGTSTGIGAAAAAELARRGFRVFAGIRQAGDGERLKALSAEIVPLPLDVTDGSQIAAAAETVGKSVGTAGLAGLVNNAGIVVAGPLEILPLDVLRRQLEVNVVGPVAVIQAMTPLLRKARGRIVNIGSVNGRMTAPYLAPYSASKHALEAITCALRSELRAWGISVSIIEAGATATAIWDKSLAAAGGLAEQMPEADMRLYRDDLDAMTRATRELARGALPVETVVRCIVHALTARRPRPRYPVGLKVNLLLRAHKWIPDRLWDRIVQRSLGLPQIEAP